MPVAITRSEHSSKELRFLSKRARKVVAACLIPRLTGTNRNLLTNFTDFARELLPDPARDKAIDIWRQDEARVEQQSEFTRVRALKGTNPKESAAWQHLHLRDRVSRVKQGRRYHHESGWMAHDKRPEPAG